ncbi:hypothetical protein BDL97_12G056600 [Sphagnum fallax]|nr:hypothetical protein BDL97_12G056600 [Sphagnum fallax]KAH8945745.1 hypothetical protein BDL97_12G056600 [Sphagnum fallax]
MRVCKTTLLCSSCCFCCWKAAAAQERSQSLKVASNSTVVDWGDAGMTPSSAPVVLLPPAPVASAAAVANESPCGINGHSRVPSGKLPGKSNLKQSFPSAYNHAPNNGASRAEEEHLANPEPGEDYATAAAGAADVVVNEPEEKRHCKVQWIDNFGEDLAQIHEFEPSDSGDSDDDDDDGESSQACTCVIQ